MRRLLSSILLIPILGQAQITIKITLNGSPDWNTKLAPAHLKYNKYARFGVTVDDRQTTGLDLAAYYTGGVSPAMNKSYPGHTFTDGANVKAKKIPWTGSVATNAWYNMDSTLDCDVNKGTMNWQQVKTMVNRNWSLLDHGAFHGIGLPGPSALHFNTLMNAAANRNYTFRKLAELGDEYVLRCGVVPTNDPDYHSAWEQLGYTGGSSEATDDGYPNTVPAWQNFGLVNVTNWINDNRYKVHLRHFKDLQAGFNSSEDFLGATMALCSKMNPVINYSLEHGLHNATMDTIQKVIDSFYNNSHDHIWVCGLQEFYEYFETIQQTHIVQSLAGNVLTVTLDQSLLPEDQRWRDMSLLLNSTATIKNVEVKGADDYSYNTETGLINIYKKKTKGFSSPPNYNATGFVFNNKMPLELNDFYIDNNYDNKPVELIDGNTSTQFHARFYDHDMIYTPYEVTVDLSDYGAVINKIRMYVGGENNYHTTVLLVRNDNEQEVSIGSFPGSISNQWIDFTITGNKFVASRLILRSDHTNGFGNELEVYADYLPYKEQTYPHRHAPLGQMLGVNAHWWNFVKNGVSSSSALEWYKIKAFDSLHLHSLRNYGNAQEYSFSNGGQYAFNPVVQGWFEDLFMRQLKSDNPGLVRWSVLQGQFHHVAETWNHPDLKWQMKGVVTNWDDRGGWGVLTLNIFQSSGTGNWSHWYLNALSGNAKQELSDSWHVMPASLPEKKIFIVGNGGYKKGDTISIKARHVSQLNYLYTNNNNAARSLPVTWDTVAKLAYNWAARKGTNVHATKFNPYTPNLTWMENNNDSVGLGTSEWTEIMNEPNAFWAGYDDYLNGQHLAVAWSKIYDNNKQYSSSLGAKNADPNMVVSTSGLAVSTVDLNRSADFWSKKNRGSRPKISVPMQPNYWRATTFGWADNPYDVIQFHNYSYTGGSNQFAGGVNAGLPPELSNCLQAVDEFVWFRNKYAPWALVDVGEWGYDIHPNSPMNAPSIDHYTAEEVRGAWAIRTMLEYNAHGVDYAQWYRLYQDGDDSSNATQFATMSLLKDNGNGTVKRKVAGNYFRQLSDFSDYVFDTVLREDSLRVIRFKNTNHEFYAIWSVEKIKIQKEQRPVFSNRTGTYHLPLHQGTRICIRRFVDDKIEMSKEQTIIKGNSYPINYDLKPVFVEVLRH